MSCLYEYKYKSACIQFCCMLFYKKSTKQETTNKKKKKKKKRKRRAMWLLDHPSVAIDIQIPKMTLAITDFSKILRVNF